MITLTADLVTAKERKRGRADDSKDGDDGGWHPENQPMFASDTLLGGLLIPGAIGAKVSEVGAIDNLPGGVDGGGETPQDEHKQLGLAVPSLQTI